MIETGWTAQLIDKLLGRPDAEAENPHHTDGAPMKLYLLTRIENVEKTEAFRCASSDLAAHRARHLGGRADEVRTDWAAVREQQRAAPTCHATLLRCGCSRRERRPANRAR